MIKVSIHLINGDLQELLENDNFISRLDTLQRQGYKGKVLVNELITDDWGAPPVYVQITGTTSGGAEINVRIPYN